MPETTRAMQERSRTATATHIERLRLVKPELDAMYTLAEAAKLLGITRHALQKRITRGDLTPAHTERTPRGLTIHFLRPRDVRALYPPATERRPGRRPRRLQVVKVYEGEEEIENAPEWLKETLK